MWNYRHTVLGLCMLAFFSTMVARLAISPVVPSIISEFRISNAQIGLALTGMWMAYSLTQFPSGILGDRFGERRVILVSIGGTAIGSLLVAISPWFFLFVLWTILLGAVAGLHYTVATTLLTTTYDDVGTAVGIHTAGGPLAGLVAPVVAAWVGVQFGWRPAVAIAVVVAVPVFLLFAIYVRPTPPRNPDEAMRKQIVPSTVIELITRPPIAFTIFIAVLGTFAWQATASFLPTFLVAHRGLGTIVAGALFSLYFVVHGSVQIGVGYVSDRYGRDSAIAGCMIAGAIGYGILVMAPGMFAIFVGIILIGTGMSYLSAMIPRFLDEFSEAESGTGLGLVRTVYMFTGALGSVGVGFIADVASWGAAFGILSVLLTLVLIGIVLNWTLKLGL